MNFRSGLISRAAALTVIMAGTSIGCSDPSPAPGGARRDAPAARANKERHEITAQAIAPYGALLKAHEHGEQRALRIKVDAVRNRLWVLGMKHVYVYDITDKQLIRRGALPNWSVAGFVCPPDMALDQSGAAFLASNVESTLWKIDAEDFAISALDITLLAKANRDIGFDALTVAGDGALYALTAHDGSLWRIDVVAMRGNEIALSERMLNTCTLKAPNQRIQSGLPRTVVLCAAAVKNSRQIVIAPDFTRGHVSTEKCPS